MAKFKDFPKAGEVAHGQAESLEAYDGIELLLDRFELSDTLSFGKKANLFCRDEADREVKIFTFSQVVVDQLNGIADQLPCLITIEKHGNYYTIY